MRIYIDESGSFTSSEKAQSFSCVTALIVPETIEKEFFKAFSHWKNHLSLASKRDKNGEIKGSSLNEEEFASLLTILSQYDVLVETVCIDTGTTAKEVIENIKQSYATSCAKSNFGQKLNSQFDRDALMSLSCSNFTEAYVISQLLNKVLIISIPYYLQRFPEALKSWSWVIDAKGKNLLDYEKILAQIVKPLLQSIHSKNPIGMLEGEDTSVMSEWLIPYERLLEPWKTQAQEQGSSVVSFDKIMKNMSFEQSHENLGLQIVDMLASCIGRAMRGNLRFEGWKYMPGLMVLRKKQSIQAIEIIRFPTDAALEMPLHTRQFVNYMDAYGKQMIVPEELRPKITKGYIHWKFLETLTGPKRLKMTVIHF